MKQETEQIQEIHKDMTMGVILEKYPATAEIMLRYGLHCVGCHINTMETLEQGIKGHGGSDEHAEQLVNDMNNFIRNQKFSDDEDIAITEKAAEKIKEVLKENSGKHGLKIQ